MHSIRVQRCHCLEGRVEIIVHFDYRFWLDGDIKLYIFVEVKIFVDSHLEDEVTSIGRGRKIWESEALICSEGSAGVNDEVLNGDVKF